MMVACTGAFGLHRINVAATFKTKKSNPLKIIKSLPRLLLFFTIWHLCLMSCIKLKSDYIMCMIPMHFTTLTPDLDWWLDYKQKSELGQCKEWMVVKMVLLMLSNWPKCNKSDCRAELLDVGFWRSFELRGTLYPRRSSRRLISFCSKVLKVTL